jgi:twitching motility two-component system response regulator PilH
VGFFGHLFSFFRRKSLPENIADQLEERRLRPRVNPKEGTRVLVIDDSPTILTAMKRFLESSHCVFLCALDAKKGMEVALTQKPDLIFLDIVMPGINGFAALRALRKNARTRETPIIMMSGNEQAKVQFFGVHIGADDFMKKPFSRFEVFGRIARLLDDERVPRRPPSDASAQEAQPAAESSSEEVVISPQAPPQQTEAETPPPPSPPEEPAVAIQPTQDQDESPEPVLVPAQIVAPPVAEPAPESPLSSVRPPVPTLQIQILEEDEPAEPPQAQPEPSPISPPFSAQVVSITPQPIQQPQHPSVAPELLTRIARLAQLAQSDPEALKALVVLSARLATEYTAAMSQGIVAQPRAAAT